MKKKYFGTDGIRGEANSFPMTPEVAMQLGRAAAYYFYKTVGKHHAVVIGKDTRLSGYMLETALASGICSVGVNVMLVGPMPTPGIAFITEGMRADAGIVISASHNRFDDNGIKFFDQNGYKLPDNVELEIERLMDSDELKSFRPRGENIGKAIRLDDANSRYLEYLKRTFPKDMKLEGMKIVVDCSNGAAYKVAPQLFYELGAEVIKIGAEPDGININVGCGSVHPELMCKTVRENNADLGIALDGDADRIIMCDENGDILDGDHIIALNAKSMQKEGRLKKNKIVATSMSNLALDFAMRSLGIGVIRANVGDRYVVQEMVAGGYNLGGEQSGHIIFLEHNTTGDGMLAGLQTIAILKREGLRASDVRKMLQLFPQILTNVKVKEKKDFTTLPKLNDCIERVKKELGDKGRVLVRYSGTEMLARVMIEGEDPEKIKRYAADITEEINISL